MELSQDLRRKYERVRARCSGVDRAVIAYSGGVDSTLLAKIAFDVLGDCVLAVTADSESLPRRELRQARELAEEIGVRHEVVQAFELENPDYAENSPRRCYFCKTELFTQLERVAGRAGSATIMYGANTDDVGDFRPGMEAARERGVIAPLLECEITKDEVRILSRELGLRTWDKAAFACLSLRFPHGTRITSAKLAQVDSAEDCLHELAFRQFRVRHHEDGDAAIARIEVSAEEIARFFEPAVRLEITDALRKLGYRFVSLDLEGYRPGNLNPGLLNIEGPSPASRPDTPGSVEVAR